MNLKAKMFTLLIIGVLSIPIMFGGNSGGQVLGVNEDLTDTSRLSSNFSNPFASNEKTVKTSQLGSIASGISDDTTDDDVQILEGEIVWDGNTKIPVASDKFEIGQGLQIVTETGTFNLVVGDKRLLSSSTLLVVDESTFVELGGDPSKQDSISVVVSKNLL